MTELAPADIMYSTAHDIRRLTAVYLTHERGSGLDPFKVLPSIRWNEDCPSESEGPGCYAVYGENGWLLYVGMSVTNVAVRIRSHRRPEVQHSWFWKAHPPLSIDIISVPQRWDAPSLEEYLTFQTKRYLRSKGETGPPRVISLQRYEVGPT